MDFPEIEQSPCLAGDHNCTVFWGICLSINYNETATLFLLFIFPTCHWRKVGENKQNFFLKENKPDSYISRKLQTNCLY